MDWTQKLKLRDLEMLIKLASSLNISQTARSMNKTQPGISKWLRELELEIGAELFHRSGKRLSLTMHGETLVQHARRLIAVLDVARDDMDVLSRRGAGLVTIGITGASSADALPMGVLELQKASPDIHIRLIENNLETLSSKLVEGSIDLMIAQSGCTFDNDIIASEYLYDDPICMVTRAGHPLDDQAEIAWKDIVAFPLVLWAPGTPMRQAFDQAVARNRLSLPGSFIESNSTSITLNMLFHSDMVALALLRPARRYEQLGLLTVVPIDLGESGSISMYSNKAAGKRKVVAHVLNGIRKIGTAYREERLGKAGSGSGRV